MPQQADYRFSMGSDDVAHEVVRAGLEAFNVGKIGDYAYQDFALYARDAEDQVVGGMFGHSGMGWLHDSQRGRGLGARLLGMAEEEARQRGCSGVFLYTYSFQAPDFYQKQGYQLMGVLEDCPPGYQRIYLKKSLAA